MTFLELAEKILKEKKEPLTPSEIWEIASKKGYDKELGSKGKTPNLTLYSTIFRELKKQNTLLVAVSSEPLTVYHNEVLTLEQAQEHFEARLKKKERQQPKFDECELHPILCYFAFNRFRAYTKTIKHSTSKDKQREFGQWLHPDMIGCYFIMETGEAVLDDEITTFSKMAGNLPIKLFSFEIKRYLDFTNLRDSFFQAVSNSSWSHEGYLVAPRQHTAMDDPNFLYELKRLSVSFGIGIILLDLEEFDNSEILYPAQTRNLNWETITKLAINGDFKSLIKSITDNLGEKRIKIENYDTIISAEEIDKKLKNLGNKK